jgi:acyl-CoA dehydrogenase
MSETADVPEVARLAAAQQSLLYDVGWLRMGWPEAVGGLGGNELYRAELYDQMWRSGFGLAEMLPSLEVALPALIQTAPDIARAYFPTLLRADELWAQGFSEPEAGSDLAALRTKATRTADGWVIAGQKIWSSFAIVARRAIVLARTGDPAARHRSISAFLVDLTSPGVEVRPIRVMTGRHELAEMFFDDVAVPESALIGELDGGWGFAMRMLQYERGMFAWMRQAWLHLRIEELASRGDLDARKRQELGHAFLTVSALRVKSRRTVGQLAAGLTPGPDTSIDKLLLADAEQSTFDCARNVLGGDIELSPDPSLSEWATAFLHTRSASIYGGAREIQRDLVAQRVLGLPRG